MTDNILKDNEIKKALECCGVDNNCSKCPYYKNDKPQDPKCLKKSIQSALGYINRLEAENERLSKITRPLIAEIKAEAYTEFAERLKEKSFETLRNYGLTKDVVEVCDIDNLLKEIICDDKVNI